MGTAHTTCAIASVPVDDLVDLSRWAMYRDAQMLLDEHADGTFEEAMRAHASRNRDLWQQLAEAVDASESSEAVAAAQFQSRLADDLLASGGPLWDLARRVVSVYVRADCSAWHLDKGRGREASTISGRGVMTHHFHKVPLCPTCPTSAPKLTIGDVPALMVLLADIQQLPAQPDGDTLERWLAQAARSHTDDVMRTATETVLHHVLAHTIVTTIASRCSTTAAREALLTFAGAEGDPADDQGNTWNLHAWKAVGESSADPRTVASMFALLAACPNTWPATAYTPKRVGAVRATSGLLAVPAHRTLPMPEFAEWPLLGTCEGHPAELLAVADRQGYQMRYSDALALAGNVLDIPVTIR